MDGDEAANKEFSSDKIDFAGDINSCSGSLCSADNCDLFGSMDMSWNKMLQSTDPELDVVDSRLGLTKRERLIVQKTWKDVCLMGEAELGVALFDL